MSMTAYVHALVLCACRRRRCAASPRRPPTHDLCVCVWGHATRGERVRAKAVRKERETRAHTPVGRKGIRFLFRNPAAEPHTIRALVRVFVGVTQNDLETPSGDPGRVFFSV